MRIATDETDFASVLGIISTHRSRALMSVNVESLLTYWEIGETSNFFQPVDGKSWEGAEPENIFQLATGKCMAQCKLLLIPKEVLQRTFEEYLALPAANDLQE